ncbi:MAG: chemotaxis response regulator protein-glutamate methylesterase [Pseudomonadota bacterium]
MALGTASSGAENNPYRVMVVDDSAVIRGLVSRTLESDPEISVVVTAANGKIALSMLERHDIEIVVLDIEMPVMDGLTALPLLLKAKPGLTVLMASTLTQRNAEISLKALQAGAADYVPKPGTGSQITSATEFHEEMRNKAKALGAAARKRSGRLSTSRAIPTATASQKSPLQGSGTASVRATVDTSSQSSSPSPSQTASQGIMLRKASVAMPEAIAIGSSTGGPQALFEVLGGLGPNLKLPIFVTQHMPATFTSLLAQHINRASKIPSQEGQDVQKVRAGEVYVAPGDYHMTLEGSARDLTIHLDQNPPENFCRPSVDPMLRSLSKIYGSRLLVIILTGMGSDGLEGCRSVVAAGGSVVAQDEATSVVWGMPGAVAQAGVCSAVLPLKEIAGHTQRLLARTAA